MTPVTATAHPAWCSAQYCTTAADGTARHSTSPCTWRPDEDSELTVRRIWVDEADSEVRFELTVHDRGFGGTATVALSEEHATRLCAVFAQLRDLTATSG